MCKHFLGCNAGVGVCTCLHEYISQCQTGNANVKHFVNLMGMNWYLSEVFIYIYLVAIEVSQSRVQTTIWSQPEVSVWGFCWFSLMVLYVLVCLVHCYKKLFTLLGILSVDTLWGWVNLSCPKENPCFMYWLPQIHPPMATRDQMCKTLLFQIISIVILLQLSHFFPLCPSPLNPPPSPTVSSHPVVHVYGSFTHVLCLLLQPFIQWQSRIKLKFLSMV